jgi:hypothetical protein
MKEQIPKTDDGSIFSAYLEQYGKAISLISGILLLFSVFYDYTFLSALSLSFNEVPTTLADHVRSAVIWVPPVAITLFAGYIYGAAMFTVFMHDDRTDKDNPASAETEGAAHGGTPSISAKTKRRSLFLRTGKAVGVVMVIALVKGLFKALPGSWCYALFAFAWFWIAIYWLPRHAHFSWLSNPMNPREKTTAIIFILGPAAFAFVGYVGSTDGEHLQEMLEKPWKVTIKTEEGIQTCNVLGLRRFSAATILVGPDSVVSVLPSDRVVAARKIQGVAYDQDVMCPTPSKSTDK